MTDLSANQEKRQLSTFRTFSLFFIFIVSACLFSSSTLSAKQALPDKNQGDLYDAVFVLDTSYSMSSTDKEQIASEVINMFMDMSMAERTRIGFIAYNHQIVATQPLISISVADRKTELKRKIKTLRRSGYTDLGLGLRKGMDLLEMGKGLAGRKAFLILLSDGETDFGPYSSSGRKKADSARDVRTAIEQAKSKGYPVYTIGLNHDGSVNQKELERIASETGGSSYITSSTDDLPEIFNQIFASQVRSVLVPIAGVTTNGSLQEVKINIPNSSMEEANIILLSEHPIQETQLFYNSENIRLLKSDKYTLLKISHPQQGTASLKFRGTLGDLIKINLLGNYSIEAVTQLKQEPAVKGQPTKIEAYLASHEFPDQRLQDASAYQSLKAELIVHNLQTNQEERVAMHPVELGFETEYTFPQSGKFTWKVLMDGANFYRETGNQELAIQNLAPVVTEPMQLSLVQEDGDVSLKLADYVQDPNNDSLKYTLSENARGIDASIADGILTLASLPTGTSSMTIVAADAEGGIVTVPISLEVRSKYALLRIIIISVLALIGIGAVLFLWLRPKPQFTGRLEGYFLNTASGTDIPVKYWPLTSFTSRKVSLANLFQSLDVHEPLQEAAQILFEPGKNGLLFIKHDTRCIIQIGSTPLPRGKKERLNYNDKLYITFEDGVTEIELRYKAIKPSTNIYIRSNQTSEQA